MASDTLSAYFGPNSEWQDRAFPVEYLSPSSRMSCYVTSKRKSRKDRKALSQIFSLVGLNFESTAEKIIQAPGTKLGKALGLLPATNGVDHHLVVLAACHG
jgi:hypothetical protein